MSHDSGIPEMYYRRTAEVNNILNNFVSCILTVTIEKGKVEFENLKKIPGKGCYANQTLNAYPKNQSQWSSMQMKRL